MFNRRLLSAFIIIAVQMIVMSQPAAVHAQEALANIGGTVVDVNGAVIPEVKITVTNDSTRLQREATAGGNGYFVVPLLPAGNYTLTAERTGFATITVTDVVLQVGINSTVNITLQPGGVAESVSVVADTNQIDITGATLKYSVTNEQVQGLPVLTTQAGRNVLNLLPFLIPGVSPTDVFGTARNSNGGGRSMSINGARPESNSFNFDGGSNNDNEFNESAARLPNPDALQEFTILTNSYPADQGRSSGGIVNAVSKSGTNQLHGNARYIGINEAFNARGFFDVTRPVNRLHTYGGQVGGPVVVPGIYNGRDRTFFFVDFEGTRSHRATTFTFPNVLTERERTGDFSALPASQRPRDPLTGQPFPNGVIPTARINPISRVYLERFIPLPNNGVRAFTTQLPTNLENDGVTTNFIHKLGKDDTLNATVIYNRSDNVSNFGSLPVSTRRNFPQESWSAVISETHTFSTRVVNQFTGSFTRVVNQRFNTIPEGTGISPGDVGITGIHPQTERYLAVPSISVTGTSVRIDPASTAFNQDKFKTLWQLKDDLSYNRGDHTFKFGGDARGYILNSFIGNNNGSFTFSASTSARTRNAIADFLLGLPSSFNQSTGNAMYPRQKAYYFYGMDDWRAKSNLTINAGVRYELTPPLKDELGQGMAFRPGQKSQRFPNAPTGILFAGDPDPVLGTIPAGGYPTDKNNFAPRLGIAYSPKPDSGWRRKIFGDNKTAVRAAWGVFYDTTLGASFTDQAYLQPFSVTQTLSAVQIAAAGGTFANPFGSLPNPFPLDLSRRNFIGFPELEPFDPTFRTAYTYQYNLSIQRELPGAMLLEIAYVGTNSFKQDRERELNLAVVGPGATIDNIQERRLYPQLGAVISQESTGRARYDAAQLNLTRRFRNGLSFNASYVFQKALDAGSSAVLALTSTSSWARADFDRRHSLVFSYTFDLPSTRFRGLGGRIINGWQIGGLTQIRSGQPLFIQQRTNPTLTTDFYSGTPDFVGPYVGFDPRLVQTIVVNGVATTGHFLFDPNAFRAVPVDNPAAARNGSLGRNVFDGPGLNQWDLSIIKRIKITESQRIELRSDISNLFNRALFDVPETSVEAPNFGQVIRAGPGRTIQLALRYSF
jgi:hypothetical protein